MEKYQLSDLIPYLLCKHPTHIGFIIHQISIIIEEYAGNNTLTYFHTLSDLTTEGYGKCMADFDNNKSLYIIYSYSKSRLFVSKISKIKEYNKKRNKEEKLDEKETSQSMRPFAFRRRETFKQQLKQSGLYNNSISIDTKHKRLSYINMSADFVSIFIDCVVFTFDATIYESSLNKINSIDIIEKYNKKFMKIISWWKQFKNYKLNQYAIYYIIKDEKKK
eukprot:316139_1